MTVDQVFKSIINSSCFVFKIWVFTCALTVVFALSLSSLAKADELAYEAPTDSSPKSSSSKSLALGAKGGFATGQLVFEDLSYSLSGAVALGELAWRPWNWGKLSIFVTAHSFTPTAIGGNLASFLGTGSGGSLRVFFFAPVFLEGGGGAETFTTKTLTTNKEFMANSNFFFVGMGLEMVLSSGIAFELAIRQMQYTFLESTFSQTRLFQGQGGLSIYF